MKRFVFSPLNESLLKEPAKRSYIHDEMNSKADARKFATSES